MTSCCCVPALHFLVCTTPSRCSPPFNTHPMIASDTLSRVVSSSTKRLPSLFNRMAPCVRNIPSRLSEPHPIQLDSIVSIHLGEMLGQMAPVVCPGDFHVYGSWHRQQETHNPRTSVKTNLCKAGTHQAPKLLWRQELSIRVRLVGVYESCSRRKVGRG